MPIPKLRKTLAAAVLTAGVSLQPAVAEEFVGLDFGVGLSLTIDHFGDKDRVESASIVDGIVRVEDENNTIARVLLESHYFFKPKGNLGNLDNTQWGHGPFVAIQPGEQETIDATALGWMIGFRRGDSQQSWNIGIGVIVDPNTQVLGDGLVANEATTESEIRYREETETGALIVVSFGF